jgi:glycosyltransferase involved in cell wall biosynthesis
VTGPVALDVSAIPAQPAGAGIYVVELVRALAASGTTDLVLVARRDDEARWRALAGGAEVVARAPGRRPVRLAWEQVRAPSLARRLGAGVWHGPHYTLPLALRRPRVVTVHDLTFFDNPEWHEAGKVAYFTRMIRASVARADVVVSVSDRTADRLAELLAPAAPVVAVPHGVDHDRFRPEAPGGPAGDLARLAALGVAPPFVAFAGTVEPRKGLPGLVRAFSRVAASEPDLTLVLAGRPGWGSAEVAASIAASPVADRIRLLGYVEADVVPALFRAAAAVAYTPFAEGFGLPALEALACGAALVTTAGTPMADVAGDAALCVPPGDEGALAAALEALVAGGPEVARRRAAGPGVAAPWTWARCATSHAEVYRLAAGGR